MYLNFLQKKNEKTKKKDKDHKNFLTFYEAE